MRLERRYLIRSLAVVLALVVLTALGASQGFGAARSSAVDSGATTLLRDASGKPVGTVKLTQEDGAVLVRAQVHDLRPGFHAFHVHAVGECVAPFTSAGGHFNPTTASHGSHAGDLPVIHVGADGSGELWFKTDRFTLTELGNRSLIVHAGPDNYANIATRYHSHTTDTFGPDNATLAAGDAGDRVACGVIAEPK